MVRAGALVAAVFAAFAAAAVTGAHAQSGALITISIRNGQFSPAEASGSAGAPFSLRVQNYDTKPFEFASATLRVNTLVSPNSSETVQVSALPPGRYTFFDASRTAVQGTLVLK